jgi:adenosine deaminase
MLLNLHTHLEGCVRPETAAELAQEFGVSAPEGGWENAFLIKGIGNLTVFLSHVAAAYPILGSAAALRRVAFEAVEDAAADGQSYIELRFGPGTHAREGFDVHQALEAVCAGVKAAVETTGIRAGVIACLLRHEPQELVEEITRSAIALSRSGIVGIDIAGDELLYPSIERFAPLYRLAKDAGLGLTAHAAEAGPASAGREVVERLGVTRIGHGSHIADDPEILEWVRQHNVAIEVCPTSNVLTSAAASLATHPVHAFTSAGLSVVLGDDNPENTGVRLQEESMLLVREGGLSQATVNGFASASIAAAFCSDLDRSALKAILASEEK